MRSPADMEIIQIDITNSCIHNCSNCTRFCGLHKKPFFMDFETFKKAVDSLKGYKGIVGIMGGEPTLHPEFSRFIEYYKENVPDTRPYVTERYPLANFQDQVNRVKYRRGRHRGIWSSLGTGYYRHFEQIQDVFHYQVLNDHRHIDQHQALLVSRKELGIPDEKWFPLRDRCWIQNLWSASITPKGAFFCEVAAALDMLLDGPGGWPIESDWWKRTPADFGDQLHWCELCSAALNVPSASANEKCDIISPDIFERVRQNNGWKIRNGKYRIFESKDYDPAAAEHNYSPTWFLPENNENYRVSATDESLLPNKLDVFAADNEQVSTISESGIENLDFEDFLIVFTAPASYDQSLVEIVKKRIFNPGFLYEVGKNIFILNRRAAALKGKESLKLSELDLIWPKEKRVKLTVGELAGTTLKMKIKKLLGRLVHRAAFLFPER